MQESMHRCFTLFTSLQTEGNPEPPACQIERLCSPACNGLTENWVFIISSFDQCRQISRAAGLDNLLYSADADFSCFADLALTSPEDYYKPGEGSLLQ
jgi:hypothetical protein